MSNSVDPDETAHEPSRLDLRCLQKSIIIAYSSERVNISSLYFKSFYLKLLSSQTKNNGPLDFEITRAECTFSAILHWY